MDHTSRYRVGSESTDANFVKLNGASVRPSTDLDVVSATLGSAGELAMRVQSLADRLLGPAPDCGQTGENLPQAGLLPNFGYAARCTQGLMAEAFAALDRIERELPAL